ncbi:hypothetical protein BH18THE1_BH18THE1_07430 [soil metagenome]
MKQKVTLNKIKLLRLADLGDRRMLGNEQFLKMNQDLIDKSPAYFYARYSSLIFPNS